MKFDDFGHRVGRAFGFVCATNDDLDVFLCPADVGIVGPIARCAALELGEEKGIATDALKGGHQEGTESKGMTFRHLVDLFCKLDESRIVFEELLNEFL